MGSMEKKMETTILGYVSSRAKGLFLFRSLCLGFCVDGFGILLS